MALNPKSSQIPPPPLGLIGRSIDAGGEAEESESETTEDSSFGRKKPGSRVWGFAGLGVQVLGVEV